MLQIFPNQFLRNTRDSLHEALPRHPHPPPKFFIPQKMTLPPHLFLPYFTPSSFNYPVLRRSLWSEPPSVSNADEFLRTHYSISPSLHASRFFVTSQGGSWAMNPGLILPNNSYRPPTHYVRTFSPFNNSVVLFRDTPLFFASGSRRLWIVTGFIDLSSSSCTYRKLDLH